MPSYVLRQGIEFNGVNKICSTKWDIIFSSIFLKGAFVLDLRMLPKIDKSEKCQKAQYLTNGKSKII